MSALTGRHLALQILDRYDPAKSNLSKIIAKYMERFGEAFAEKGFARDLVWGVVRHLNTIDWLIDLFSKKAGIEDPVRNILRLGIFQILFFGEKVPEYAAVNESVKLADLTRRPHARGFINAVLRETIRRKDKLPWPQENRVSLLALKYSHPRWLVERWLRRMGEEETVLLCEANNLPPPLTIRVNTLRTLRQDLARTLAALDIGSSSTPFSPDGLILSRNPEIESLKSYQEGLFLVQDEASQLVSYLLDLEAGQTVLDLCSGSGIKASHIAQLTGVKAKIITVDIDEAQQERAKENFERLGITGIETVKADAGTLQDVSADRILIDAPCSGLGAVRRKPDIKWNRSAAEVTSRYPGLQKKILFHAADLLKPGGVLVYSTCTTEPEENEAVVNAFLERFPGFTLEKITLPARTTELVTPDGFFRTWPHRQRTDGFFGAKLRKAGTTA